MLRVIDTFSGAGRLSLSTYWRTCLTSITDLRSTATENCRAKRSSKMQQDLNINKQDAEMLVFYRIGAFCAGFLCARRRAYSPAVVRTVRNANNVEPIEITRARRCIFE